MRFISILPLCCVFGSFSVALAGQARADQEIYLEFNKYQNPNSYGTFGGWASCQGVPIPNNCTVATDTVSYNLYGNWNGGWADAEVVNFGQQVSPGDSAWAEIALYCVDGTFGHTWYVEGQNGGDGQPPAPRVFSSCATGITAYDAYFAYGVGVTGGS